MNHKTYPRILPLLIAVLGLLAGGCAHTLDGNAAGWHSDRQCAVPDHKQLSVALQGAQATLSERSCHYAFERIHQSLLDIGRQDPGKANKERFLNFYQWSVDQGILSSRQGKEYYNRYFTSGYGHMLPNDRNLCSLAGGQEQLIKRLDDELVLKKTGLQDILQDRDAYFDAQRTHNDLVFLLETTLLSCGKG